MSIIYFPRLQPASRAPVRRIKNGKMLKANMDRQEISEDELMSHIGQWRLDEIGDIKSVFIEGDGHISVIMQSQNPIAKRTRKAAG